MVRMDLRDYVSIEHLLLGQPEAEIGKVHSTTSSPLPSPSGSESRFRSVLLVVYAASTIASVLINGKPYK